MRELPPDERTPIETDRPVVERWLTDNPQVEAVVRVDRAAYDSNQGHVLLRVEVKRPTDFRWVWAELVELAEFPDRLRVKRWHRPPEELERLREKLERLRDEVTGDPPRPGDPSTRITVSWIDYEQDLVVLGLNRADPAYAAELEARGDGLVKVLDDPMEVFPLA